MIEAEGLGKVFGRRGGTIHAVRALSFVCHPGQVFGLLGMNGAGKTTTLRMLATILAPTAGTARVAGFNVSSQGHDVRRHLGFLTGDTRLYDRLEVDELLGYFAALNGVSGPDRRRRIDALVARFDLAPHVRRRVGRLSTGLKQRVNLARALVHDPPVLMLDEPSAGLDVLGAREVAALIRQARDEGRTVVLSTHSMREAERLCDRLAIVHEGRILREGSPSEVAAGGDLEEAFAELVTAAPGGAR